MERTLSWKRIWLIVAVLFALLLFFNAESISRSDSIAKLRNTFHGASTSGHQKELDFDIESSDSLSEKQCADLFPDQYHDIDRAIAYWKERDHTISAEDVEVQSFRQPDGKDGGGAVRILIHENELRILESLGSMGHLGYRGRVIGALYLLQRAVDSASAGGEVLPTIEASLVVQDNSDPPGDKDDTHSFWTFASHNTDQSHRRLWLFPNFDFWYAYPMGSYRDIRRRAFQHDASFSDKIPKVVWRGAEWTNREVRGGLVNTTEGKEWADVKIVDWGGKDDPNGLRIDELCKYAFTVYTEGITYSGRLKYLLACDSVPIVHKLDWTTYYSHLLKPEGPDQNCIGVERDWTDLEGKVTYYLDNPEDAQKVAENSLNTFRRRYLTRAAESCYIRKLIKGYSTVSYTPETERKSEKGDMTLRRGFSFERFMDSPQDRVYETEVS